METIGWVFLYWLELNKYSILKKNSQPYTKYWNKLGNNSYNYLLFITAKSETHPTDPQERKSHQLFWTLEICVVYSHLGICPGIYMCFTNCFSQTFFSLRPVMYSNKNRLWSCVEVFRSVVANWCEARAEPDPVTCCGVFSFALILFLIYSFQFCSSSSIPKSLVITLTP